MRLFEKISLIFAITCAVASLVLWFAPVQAAKEAPPTVTTCLLVATGGGLEYMRCQDVDRGVVFYTNQLGWMMPDPY